MAARIWIAHEWRWYWVMVVFMVIEVPVTIALLVLFGIADGDTYRTKLWQNGYDKGFNSAPNSILYDYANYRPAHVPLVWSSFTTEFNIIVSVLGMFILLTKSVLYMLHVLIPILSVFAHVILVALYSISLYNQGAPDLSDAEFPSPGLPWYLSKGCSYATRSNKSYCYQARSAYALTAVMVGLFALNTLWSIYNLVPSKAERLERLSEINDEIELKSALPDPDDEDENNSKSRRSRRNKFYPGEIPKTPNTAVSMKTLMTPRTKAFNVLNGDRGEASAVGRRQNAAAAGSGAPLRVATGVGPNRPLAFREQYGDTKTPGPA